MSSRWSRIVVVAIVALLAPTSVWAAPGPNRPTADQGAYAFLDDCPFPPIPLPSVDTPCTAIAVRGFRHWTPATELEAWLAAAEIQAVIIHPDGTYDVPAVASGTTGEATVTYDDDQLAATSLVADIAMSDGSTLAVDLQWTADEKINEGTADYGTMPPSRHFANECRPNDWDYRTIRPRIRHSAVTGTIGGESIAAFVAAGHTVWFSESYDNLVVTGALGRCGF